ncbi:hypothetical protein XENORESO_004843 [Xenotaenia resolanae]|uniref:Uncharacterized protein n=1 Tax=Xenotaenia resolanae TaxID=208358 RepID=A0ABV0WV41_9TELE
MVIFKEDISNAFIPHIFLLFWMIKLGSQIITENYTHGTMVWAPLCRCKCLFPPSQLWLPRDSSSRSSVFTQGSEQFSLSFAGDSFFGSDSKVLSQGRPRSCRGEALKQYEHHLHAERRRHLISVKWVNVENLSKLFTPHPFINYGFLHLS